jgi:N-methylhydantoinase B
MDEAISYAAALTVGAIEAIPDGTYSSEDSLDSDGMSEGQVGINLSIAVDGGAIAFDFTGSSPQRASGVNATLAVTESCCLYVVRCLLDADAPTNEGCRAGVTVLAPPGTVVNASFPAPVAGGNVETSQRIVDVALRALARALPDRIPAASQGTMNNLTFGGWDPQRDRPFAYYETIGGGGGAGPRAPGTSGVHTHMTNTRNTPVEALEYAMPLRVSEYRSVRGSGGRGLFRGGDAVRRAFEFDVPVTGTLMADRRKGRPYGLGGEAGRPGRDSAAFGGRRRRLPSKGSFALPAGGSLTVQTPSGGGWGPPE